MYPNEPCVDCPDKENDIPAPEPCGEVCAEVINTTCVIYTGVPVICDVTPIVTPGDSLDVLLASMANQICSGVSGIAGSIVVGTTVINMVNFDDPAAISIVNSGTTNAAIFDFVFDIPACEPCENVTACVTAPGEDALEVGLTNFTFPAISGPYNWDIGTRVRAYNAPGQYMEGEVTAHSSTNVTVNIDYVVGTGPFTGWTICIAGDLGDSLAGTITATSPGTINEVPYGDPAVITIGNSGTPEARILDFTFDLPAANTIDSGAVNGAGDLELTRKDASVINVGSVVGPGVTAGGTANQILKKVDGTDFNTYWGIEDASAHFPVGGTTDQIITKSSATDYDYAWTDAPLKVEKPSLPVGQIIPHIYVSTETELKNTIDQFNADQVGYLGAYVILAADITLTQDHSFNMKGIQLMGNRVFKIIHKVGIGSPYKITVTDGSPIFKDVVFSSDLQATLIGGAHLQFFDFNNTSLTVPAVVKFDGCIFKNIVMGPAATGSNLVLTDAYIGSELIITGCSILTDLAIDAGTPTVSIKMKIEGVGAFDGSITIEDMKFMRTTGKGEGVAKAVGSVLPGEEVSSIYFDFIGGYGTTPYHFLSMDMEAYALSELNSHFGAQDGINVYIKNSMLMYGDNDAAQVSLKPNGFGVMGYQNPSGPHPLDKTTYA